MAKLDPVGKLAVILLIVVAASPCVMGAWAEPVTTSQLIDDQGVGGKIFFDQQNNPHVLYHRETITDVNDQPAGLYYTVWNGAQWTESKTINYGADNIFVVDTHGNPHIINLSSGAIKDTPVGDTDWDLDSVGVATIAGDETAYDTEGTLYQLYSNGSFSGDTYASNLGCSVWTAAGVERTIIEQKVANASRENLVPKSIVLDKEGNPHVLYLEAVEHVYDSPKSWNNRAYYYNYNVKYAYWTGNNWITRIVGANVSTSFGVGNLVLDSAGQPHLCYVHEDVEYFPDWSSFKVAKDLMYTYWDGGEWVNQKAQGTPSNEGFSQAPKLRLDVWGNPQIYFFNQNYQNQTETGLKLATYNGASWETQFVWQADINSYGVMPVPDLEFDQNGNLHFLYESVVGTYHSASRYGELTHVYIQTADLSGTNITFIIVGTAALVAASVVVTLMCRKRKRRNTAVPASGELLN